MKADQSNLGASKSIQSGTNPTATLVRRGEKRQIVNSNFLLTMPKSHLLCVRAPNDDYETVRWFSKATVHQFAIYELRSHSIVAYSEGSYL